MPDPIAELGRARLPGGTKLTTVLRDFNRLRRAIQRHDTEETEAAWLDCERWLEAIFGMAWRAEPAPTAEMQRRLDEAKAATEAQPPGQRAQLSAYFARDPHD